MIDVVIRTAEPRDAATLVELARAVSAEPEGWLLSEVGGWRSVGEERRYVRAIRRHPDAAVLVADAGGIIVGRLSVARDPHPASRHVGDLGLMVARAYRRQGIGRLLLLAAEEWARGVGITKLELHVFPYNTGAIALYEQVGYEREGYRRGHYRRADALVDAILMAKSLG